MSEYLCSSRAGTFEGCNDCQGIRRVISGKAPRGMKPCACAPRWCLFCKRTDDPKLAWIEQQLTAR